MEKENGMGKIVAITGHRPKKLLWNYEEDHPSCVEFKSILAIEIDKLINQGYDTFMSGMAEGIDMIFSEMILGFKAMYPHIKHVCVIPFEQQHVKWHPSMQERYFEVLSRSDDVITMYYRYHKDCYKERNQYLVDNADYIIAVQNSNDRSSGTLMTINMAKRKNKQMSIIVPATKKIKHIRPYLNLVEGH